jgi:thiamine biosynthesis lipoprotein
LTLFRRLKRKQHRALLAAIILPFILTLPACSPTPRRTLYTFQGKTMGTTFAVKIAGPEQTADRLAEMESAIQEQLQSVDAKMSTYRADSELSRFNATPATEPFELSSETFEVFRHAQQISAETQGAFDITVGPLVNLWGFGPGRRAASFPSSSIPAPEQIERIKLQIGWDKIKLDEAAVTVSKLQPELSCDLSAIAKGYAVDQVSGALSQLGITEYMVEIGGEVGARGKNEQGSVWRIGIESPQEGASAIQRLLPIENAALATSGDYRNFFESEGVRYSHTIDPRTGMPVRHHLASVSVIDPLCVRADGYATALMVMGETAGYRFAVENELPALFLIRDDQGGFSSKASPAFEARFGSSP